MVHPLHSEARVRDRVAWSVEYIMLHLLGPGVTEMHCEHTVHLATAVTHTLGGSLVNKRLP